MLENTAIGSRLKRILFIITAILMSLCFYPSAQGKESNVVLIILNAARADHLDIYGYGPDTAPNITNLAKKGIIFQQAIAQSYWTLPSLASMLTSRYPYSLGVYERDQRISQKELTLAEILKIYGYRTAAFVGGLDTLAVYGFNQGFDHYFDKTADKPMGSFKDTIPRAIDWLKENRDAKFFLLVQGYDVHPPFTTPAPYQNMFDPDYKGIVDKLPLDYPLLKTIHDNRLFLNGKTIKLTRRDIDHIIARYDAGIAYADKFIGELLAQIDKLGLWDETMIVFTSEHGEELNDHGSFDRFETMNLYDEVIRVPLIIKPAFADLKGKRIKQQVELIDIMPTILDFLGIPINKEAQGASLIPLIKGGDLGEDFDGYAFSEANLKRWSIRTEQWKLIYNHGEYELYNLEEDKGEVNNLVSQHPEVVYELFQRSSDWRKMTQTQRSLDDVHIELTEEMKEKLRKVGYW
jgi:arylsulfatase A-like enzyme